MTHNEYLTGRRKPVYLTPFFLRMKNISEKKICKEYQNTHFIFITLLYFTFVSNRTAYEIMWKKCNIVGQSIYGNMTHTHFMLDTYRYKQTRRICNTYSTPSRLAITLYVYCPGFVI
jgi:hypothetical protein